MNSPSNHKLIVAGAVGIAGLVWVLSKLQQAENQDTNRRPRTPSNVPNVGNVFFTDMLLGVAIGNFVLTFITLKVMLLVLVLNFSHENGFCRM